MLTITKQFQPLPFAHRLPEHPGACRYLHGHTWRLAVTFAAERLDAAGFVLDFGGLPMRALREVWGGFDHALILGNSDPLLDQLGPICPTSPAVREAFGRVYVLPAATTEGIAAHLFDVFNTALTGAPELAERQVRVSRLELWEGDSNSATVSEPHTPPLTRPQVAQAAEGLALLRAEAQRTGGRTP